MSKQSQALNEELMTFLDIFPQGVVIIGMDKRIRQINTAALAISGYSSASEVIGLYCHELFQVKNPGECPVIDKRLTREQDESWLITKTKTMVPVFKTVTLTQFMGEDVVLETFIDLRDYKQVQQDLSEMQRLLNNLLKNLPGMVYRCRNDQSWTMEFVSQGSRDLTGYMPSELINNSKVSYGDIIHPDDRMRVWEIVQQQVGQEQPFSMEYRIVDAASKVKWVKEFGRSVSAPASGIGILEGFITEITEEKRNELVRIVLFEISKACATTRSLDDLLKITHEQLGKILDASNFYVALYEEDTDTITLPYHVDIQDKFASFPAGKTLTGYVIKTKKPTLVTEDEINALVKAGKIDLVGTPAKVWIGVPFVIDDKVIGVVSVQNYQHEETYSQSDLDLLTFVADQIAGLISRQKAADQLKEEQAYLDQLYQSSSEAITMIDTQGTVQSVNLEFSRLFGYQPSDIIGKQIDESIVPKYLKDEGIRNTNRALTNERVERESISQKKNGMLIDVSILVTPIFINGQIVGAYGIYRDITERKRIEKSLIIAKEKAEESDRLKSAFLSNMSHEIRTPMNAILGFSSLLSDGDSTPEERSEYIEIIKDRGNDLMRIISDIIDVAKIESGQLKINIKDCKINYLLEDILTVFNQMKKKQEKQQVELATSLENPDSEFTILTDPQRLRQVITNLIENALKFTESGSVRFGYTLKEDPGIGKSIIFFVEDTGIGIPSDMLNVIFERFRQVDDSHTRKYGGTGLGLTICKNLVHLMGGNLSVASEVGKGTRFTITLPMWTISAPKEQPIGKKPDSGTRNWTGRVILIAEDEDSNYTFLEHVLKRTGVSLLWAKSGQEAVNMAKIHNPGLILMDIRMPGMDGYEATDLIKKDNPAIPIIAQTAYALKGEKELSLNAGCDDYISKPINIGELMTVLNKYLK